jgi:hypothetical protein
MRLPSTFFFRLDCHQAAIVVGFFDLVSFLGFCMGRGALKQHKKQTRTLLQPAAV